MAEARVRLFRFLSIAFLCCMGIARGDAPPSVPPPLSSQRVLDHVSHTLTWFRGMGALQQMPADSEDLVPRSSLAKTALTSLQLAFEFGHAAASLAGNSPATPASGASSGDTKGAPNQQSSLDQAADRISSRMAQLQAQLSDIDQQISHAAPKDRQMLSAKRGEISAALDLTREIQGTIGQVQRFEETVEAHESGAAGSLAAQLADLQKTVPELRSAPNPPGASASASAGQAGAGASDKGTTPSPGAPAPAPPAAATPAPAPASDAGAFRPESAGVITLFGKWFSLEGSRRQLSDATHQTEALQKNLEALRTELTKDARALVNLGPDVTATDPSQLAQSKQNLEAAAMRFKRVATLLVPLGEQGVTLDDAHSLLEEWRDGLAARIATVARYLALRLTFLLGSIAVVLIISEVWRRATFRYLQDTRRRQQFLALRRVAVGLALTVVILFGLVSEVGSLATYAGLITAGLAVALQNVILAVVAYFFLIGRYGVRVGDRITLAGVTGRVVEIGLVRIYLMELTGPQLRSSGRMVVLSNAVLFQPTALFKQMPGADFYWHTITLTVAATADVAVVEKRLSDAAQSVYEKYRSAIEQRHAVMQRFIDFQTAMPAPEVYARLSGKGLECTVRYPVEPSQAVVTDQGMLVAVREAQAKDPPLELIDGPVLDTSES
jgi:small-conductance mechanosensitive channel